MDGPYVFAREGTVGSLKRTSKNIIANVSIFSFFVPAAKKIPKPR
jgi:hypothetical protein